MVLDPGALHTLATQTCPESIWVLPLSVFGRRLPTHRRGMYTAVQRTGELRGAPQACSTLSNPAGRGQAALAVCTLAVRPSSVALPSDASGRAPACLAPPWRLWWPGLLPQSCTHIRSPMPLCSCPMRLSPTSRRAGECRGAPCGCCQRLASQAGTQLPRIDRRLRPCGRTQHAARRVQHSD